MVQRALIWPISGGVSVLDLVGGKTTSYPFASNDDGSVVVGYCDNGGKVPVRWDTLAVTQLAAVTSTNIAVGLSRDASIVVGSAFVVDTSHYSRWTSGGSAGANLTPATGYTGTQWNNDGAVHALPFRPTSDDGTIIVGSSTGGSGGNPANVATVWTAGTPATLPSSAGGTAQSLAFCCSQDGSVIIGLEDNGSGSVNHGTYWTGGTSHPLVPITNTHPSPGAFFANGAGTIIYGTSIDGSGNDQAVYWDSLSTVAGGLYGVIHKMDRIGDTSINAPVLTYCSETGDIAVGFASDGTTTQAVKWSGTTATILPILPGGNTPVPYGCSADGSIVVGYCFDSDNNQQAVYWDAGNVIHLLPLPHGFGGPSVALGIGRTGTLAWGISDGEAPGVPVPFCGDVHTTASLTAAWTPTGATADSYTLDYRKVGDVSFTEITGITATYYLITGLDPGTTYEFKVKAVNIIGTSAFSPTLVQCSTDAISPIISLGGGATLCGWRGLSGINWHGMALVGDKFSNVIGLSDFSIFTEYGNGMRFLITSPPVHSDRKRIFVPRFEIEVEAGLGTPGLPEAAPLMTMDLSKDGGVTWQPLQKFRSMGAAGKYLKRLRWLRLGNARQWVFRLQYTDTARPAVIGTYIDMQVGLS